MINRGIQQFDYSVDVLQAILWQYDNAPNIKALLTSKQNWYNTYQTQFWQDWYTNVFNLYTANLFGLSVWSYILDLPLFVESTPDEPGKPLWGFNAYNPSYPTLENTYFNFGFGNFSSRNGDITLTEQEQRLILLIRAYQITSSGNIWDINAFFEYLFTHDSDYAGDMITVLDGLDMTMTYVFNWDVSYPLRWVLVNYDILPRPAGVGLKYVVLPVPGAYFGFNTIPSENGYLNFGNGNFPGTFI